MPHLHRYRTSTPQLASTRRGPDGFTLHDSLCALFVLGTGLLPLMGLAPQAMGHLREQETINRSARLALEFAETDAAVAIPDRCAGTPTLRLCAEADKLVTATWSGGTDGLSGMALWVRP
ncbi:MULTISPECIES: hypothetical protein [unclassified Cupriavidus]|uniref:type IV pilus modification PilV family protein n=1 Tax=unclassified Cupriavidus TaxID=2640874 RepID=UPI00048C1E59|nr:MULTISPECIES: hypothetical protein [unclassified Cupriavidus]MBP0629969.1 hypothetical protein [Cupriavidus sp. AcVe19-1a]MBP0634688.1 hypothetical protein [Cupriavidus sp. AcVe19-6a]